MDWPYTPFHGRDESYTAATTEPMCAVLDRLPHFQYRVRTDADFVRSGVRTTQGPGACHMGRAAVGRAEGPDGGACWRASEGADGVHMRCANGASKTMEKRRIKTPHEAVREGLRRRAHCSGGAEAQKCDAPPKFFARKRAGQEQEEEEMPVPEVGYGRPFRWEMARTIAGLFSSLSFSFVARNPARSRPL